MMLPLFCHMSEDANYTSHFTLFLGCSTFLLNQRNMQLELNHIRNLEFKLRAIGVELQNKPNRKF